MGELEGYYAKLNKLDRERPVPHSINLHVRFHSYLSFSPIYLWCPQDPRQYVDAQWVLQVEKLNECNIFLIFCNFF